MNRCLAGRYFLFFCPTFLVFSLAGCPGPGANPLEDPRFVAWAENR